MSVGTDLLMRSLAKTLDEKLNGIDSISPLGDLSTRQNGFVLLVFSFGAEEGRRTNYVSNGDRHDILTALKEIVARFEGQPEIQGRA